MNIAKLPSVLMLTGALAILALLLLLGIPSTRKAPTVTPELRHVTAIGEAELKVKPDQAVFRFQVQQRSFSAATAEAAHHRQLDQFTSHLHDAGLDNEKIVSGPISLHEVPDAQNGLTWMAESEARVTLKDLSKVDDLLSSVLEEKGAKLTGVEYGLTSPDPQIQKALDAALASAQVRAEAIAGSASGTLGAPVSVEMLGSPTFEGDSPDLVILKLSVKAVFPM